MVCIKCEIEFEPRTEEKICEDCQEELGKWNKLKYRMPDAFAGMNCREPQGD